MDKFGLELLRLSVGGDSDSGVFGSRANAVIVLAHWKLLSDGFRCVGNGETFSADGDISPPTEALPPGWDNMDDGIHCLRYRHKTSNEKFILKSFVTATESDQAGASSASGGQHQTVILLRVGDDKTAEIDVNLTEEIKESEGKFKPVHEDQLLAKIEEKLVRPLVKKEEGGEAKKKKEEDQDRRRDPLRDPRDPPGGRDPRNPRGPPRIPDMPDPDLDPDNPFNPFGPGGGPNGPLWDPLPGMPPMGPPGAFPGPGRGGFPGGPRGGFPGPRGGFPGGPGGFPGGGFI